MTPKNNGRSNARMFSHISETPSAPPEMLIENCLEQNSLAALVAPSYYGKSLMTIKMAVSVATGTDFHGHKVKQRPVYFIAAENSAGIIRGLHACLDRDQIAWDAAHLFTTPQAPNLRDPDAVAQVMADMGPEAYNCFVIIDTMSKTFGGGNENAPQDMSAYISGAEAIREMFDATVLIIHHQGKDSSAGARGHSMFFGSLDTCMGIKKVSNGDIRLVCQKQKNMAEFEPMQFSITPHMDTVVLEPVDTSAARNDHFIGKNDQLAIDAFAAVMRAKSADSPLSPSCSLTLDEWRSEFYGRHAGDNAKTKKDIFRRSRESLVNKGFVASAGDNFIWGDKATWGDK